MTAQVQLGFHNTYATELEGLYVPFIPPGFPNPQIVALNQALLAELDVDAELIEQHAAALLSGSLLPEDASPLAQAYAGHQFGGFSPQLGDGRAVLLGELRHRNGQLRDVHLKGSGRTPFSRGGDGKATLGPILREYLMGEAMHRLGVPTSRMLAAMTTGEQVWRTELLPGAVLARIASSHLRVGTLQFFAARRDSASLARVVDYALARHYPTRLLETAEMPHGNERRGRRALALLQAVATKQAQLIAHWMRIGFIHGVMNTDNVTLSGETIDYGPCAFMDTYDPTTVFSSIDRNGRYAYGRQPIIGQWNLARLGEALLPLLADDEAEAIRLVEAVMKGFVESYEAAFISGMVEKLGVTGVQPSDTTLVADLLTWMQTTRQDFTSTFRLLSSGLRSQTRPFCDGEFAAWHGRWLIRIGEDEHTEVARRMDAVNPAYIPRNHLVEEALEAAVGGDLAPFNRLLAVLGEPYEERAEDARYAEPAPSEFGAYQTFCGT